MSGPILALRAAILARIAGDPALAAAMGDAKIHDEPPRAAAPVYALFGAAEARDAGSAGARADLQELAIEVHGRAGAAARALAAADRLAALLDDADLALAGHRLVFLALVGIAVTREEGAGLVRATLRLRALSERID